MVPMKWRHNQGDPSAMKSSFPLCSRNISRTSFSTQLWASCQPAECPNPCLGGMCFWEVGWFCLSQTFLAVAEVSLWVEKLGSCTDSSNNFRVKFLMYWSVFLGSYGPLHPDCNLLIFQKRQKPEPFLSSPSMPYPQILSEGQLSPILWWRSFITLITRNCDVTQKPQRKHRENKQCSSKSLVYWGAPGTQLTLWMKSGAGILHLGYFYPWLHKPLL